MPSTATHRITQRQAPARRLTTGTLAIGIVAASFLMIAGPSDAAPSVGGLLSTTPSVVVSAPADMARSVSGR
jgi:hypothetical protein